MIRQDYIMRMIEQLIRVLLKILFNKETGNYQEAINNIDNAFSNILGLDYNLINTLSVKDIMSLLRISKDDVRVSVNCIVIAKLLKERTEIINLSNKENLNSVYTYQKSLGLYLEGILNNKNMDLSLSDYFIDVKEIVKIIADEIPQEIRFRLFKFYELLGEYDKAEDELFKLKNLDDPNIEGEAILFYRNLEKLNDVELKKGSLSKEEIAQGLSEFIKKTS